MNRLLEMRNKNDIVLPQASKTFISSSSEPKYSSLTRQDFNLDVIKQWNELKLSHLPPRRTNHISFIYNNYLYIHGGRDINQGKMSDIYKLDLIKLSTKDEQSWEKVITKGNNPMKISHHRGCVIGNKLYTFGGIININDSINTMYILDLDILVWDIKLFHIEEVPKLVEHSMSYANIDNKDYLIVFGGQSENNYINDVYYYDIHDSVWTKYSATDLDPNMVPQPRIGHAQITYNNKIYIYAGQNKQAEYLKDMWTFDLYNKQWTKITINGEVPKGRKNHSMVLSPNKEDILIFGGKLGDLFEINQFWKYNIIKSKFTLIHDTMLDRVVNINTINNYSNSANTTLNNINKSISQNNSKLLKKSQSMNKGFRKTNYNNNRN